MNKTKSKKRLVFVCIGVLIILGVIISAYIIKTNKKENNVAQISNFQIKDIKCSKGKEITVEIELLNNSNFVAANFEYKYDSKALEYISYEIGNSLKDGAMTIVNNDKDKEKVLIGYVAKPDGEKIVKSGRIIDIKFKVKDNTTSSKIENIFDCTTLKEEDGTDIKYNVIQGVIEIVPGNKGV